MKISRGFKQWQFWGLVFVIAVTVCFILPLGIWNRKIKILSRHTDEKIKIIKENSDRFGILTQTHRAKTKRKVMKIRESVDRETKYLPPDALLSGVLDELERFRRASESGDSPGSAGLDGNARGIRRK